MKYLANSFHFKLGDFECIAIKDGTLIGPVKTGVKDSETIKNGPIMDVQCLYIQTGEHTILLDAGFGGPVTVNGILQTDVGHLLPILKDEGIKPSDIDTVVLSHLHPDHFGGITDKAGNMVFSGARHIIYKSEWDFWVSNPDLYRMNEELKRDTLTAIKRFFIPHKERFSLVDGEIEIIPGIKIIRSPGHTPGHIALQVASGKESLFCIFDMLHSPLEFKNPDHFKSSDLSVETAEATKSKIFSQVVTSQALVFTSHFPFPGLGCILHNDLGYYWKPC